MSDAKQYALAMFAACVGERFQVDDGAGDSRQWELVEATGRGTGTDAPPEDTHNFSLVFCDRDASLDACLPQASYRLEHPTLGPIDLFLVPIGLGADDKGIRYEAIFTSLDSL